MSLTTALILTACFSQAGQDNGQQPRWTVNSPTGAFPIFDNAAVYTEGGAPGEVSATAAVVLDMTRTPRMLLGQPKFVIMQQTRVTGRAVPEEDPEEGDGDPQPPDAENDLLDRFEWSTTINPPSGNWQVGFGAVKILAPNEVLGSSMPFLIYDSDPG